MRKEFRIFTDMINNVIFGKEFNHSGVNCEMLYRIAKSHGMSSVFFSFLKMNFGEESEFYKAYERRNDLINYNYIFRNLEYEAFSDFLKRENIRYIPLKGMVLKNLYPYPELREMSDADIFIDEEYASAVKEFLIRNGYGFEHKGHHDVYKKEPGICFEIHETLIDRQRGSGFDEFFSVPWNLSEHSGCEYRLTPENEYIYLIAHFYGHFRLGGIGIRSVLDIYLYKNKYCLDFEYINSVFEQYGILEFSGNILKLADVLFSGEDTDELTEELGEYIFSSGTYGKTERLNLDLSSSGLSMKENVKKTVIRKLFLNRKEINIRYPWSENKILLPVAYGLRIWDVLVNHGKEIKTWYKSFRTMDAAKLNAHKARMIRFGVRE